MATRLQVRVIPNAARDEIVGMLDGVLKVKVRAVPEDGRANRALLELLARHFGCRDRDISIVSGDRSRLKTIELGC